MARLADTKRVGSGPPGREKTPIPDEHAHSPGPHPSALILVAPIESSRRYPRPPGDAGLHCAVWRPDCHD